MTRRRLRIATALAVIVLALTGCAAPLPADADWTPREPETSAPLAVAGDTATFTSLTAAEIPGLSQHRATNTEVGVDLRWPEVHGASDLNEALEREQWSLIEAQEAATGASYAPQTQATGIGREHRGCAPGQTSASAHSLREEAVASTTGRTVLGRCEIVAAAGGMLGIRSRVIGAETDVVETVYFDTATGTPTRVSDLLSLNEAALNTLWHEAVTAIRTDAGQVTLWPTGEGTPLAADSRDRFEAALAGGVLESDGSLVIDVPGGLTGADLDSLPGRDDPNLHDRIRFAPAAIAPYLTEAGNRVIERTAGEVWQPPGDAGHRGHADCELVPCVALTYDDGPNPGMSQLLDTFAERDSVATFFFIGNQVSANTGIVQRTHDEGHELANHSWNHPDFTTLTPKELEQQISRTQDAIVAVTGAAPTLVRPPYGAYDDAVLRKLDMPVIMWDHDTLDWQGPPVDSLIADVLANAEPGSIVLLHSIHEGTIEAAPEMVDGLQDCGFELVTVSGMFDGEVPQGVIHSR